MYFVLINVPACYPCKPQITDIYWRRILLFDTDLYSCIVFSIVLLHHLSILIMSVGRRRNSSWSTRLDWTDTDWITRREPAYGFVQTVVLPRLGITRIFLHCIIYLITSHRSMSCMVQFNSNPAGVQYWWILEPFLCRRHRRCGLWSLWYCCTWRNKWSKSLVPSKECRPRILLVWRLVVRVIYYQRALLNNIC